MLDEFNDLETWGVRGSVVAAVAIFIKFLTTSLRTEKIEQSQAAAENAVYQQLRQEIERMDAKITEMEANINILQRRQRQSQQLAIEALKSISSLCTNKQCEGLHVVTDKLEKIISFE